MSNIGLFAMGTVVTLLVAGSIGLLVWGAILDGRYENDRQAADRDAPVPNLVGVAATGHVVSTSSDAPMTIDVLAPAPVRGAPGLALADRADV